ncbi:MAG: small, acid-soluble spore protein, alpha/beta type [Eubacterium sp.]
MIFDFQISFFIFAIKSKRGVFKMATVPEAKDALNRFKMEAASEVGVFLH